MSFLDLAALFKLRLGPANYHDFLRERYRRAVALSSLHRSLARLPVTTIYTTNYDKLLETAFRSPNGADPPVIIDPRQLRAVPEGSVKVIKLHGDIDHPDTIVLNQDDYVTGPQQPPPVMKKEPRFKLGLSFHFSLPIWL